MTDAVRKLTDHRFAYPGGHLEACGKGTQVLITASQPGRFLKIYLSPQDARRLSAVLIESAEWAEEWPSTTQSETGE